MIIDLRTYTLKPSGVSDFIALYREKAWPLQQKHLGHCLGWYRGLEGTLNQVVHLWAYDSQADRERRRTELYRDPAWQDYLREMGEAGHMVHAENRILAPTDFSPAP